MVITIAFIGTTVENSCDRGGCTPAFVFAAPGCSWQKERRICSSTWTGIFRQRCCCAISCSRWGAGVCPPPRSGGASISSSWRAGMPLFTSRSRCYSLPRCVCVCVTVLLTVLRYGVCVCVFFVSIALANRLTNANTPACSRGRVAPTRPSVLGPFDTGSAKVCVCVCVCLCPTYVHVGEPPTWCLCFRCFGLSYIRTYTHIACFPSQV